MQLGVVGGGLQRLRAALDVAASRAAGPDHARLSFGHRRGGVTDRRRPPPPVRPPRRAPRAPRPAAPGARDRAASAGSPRARSGGAPRSGGWRRGGGWRRRRSACRASRGSAAAPRRGGSRRRRRAGCRPRRVGRAHGDAAPGPGRLRLGGELVARLAQRGADPALQIGSLSTIRTYPAMAGEAA